MDPAAISAELADLRQRLQQLEDKDAITRLQYQYGYYIDNRMWDAMVGLFADEGAEIEIGQRGTYMGKARIHRFLEDLLGGGRWGLLQDEIIHHIQMQPLVTVAPDGLSAKARARAVVQGNSPPGSGKFLLAEGLYENDYVKEAGAWKIRRLWWVPHLLLPDRGVQSGGLRQRPSQRRVPARPAFDTAQRSLGPAVSAVPLSAPVQRRELERPFVTG